MHVAAALEQVHVEEPEAGVVAVHLGAPGKLPPQAGVEIPDGLVAAPVHGEQVFFGLLPIVVSLKVDADAGHDDLWR